MQGIPTRQSAQHAVVVLQKPLSVGLILLKQPKMLCPSITLHNAAQEQLVTASIVNNLDKHRSHIHQTLPEIHLELGRPETS